jgi:hypothetical protein
VVRTSVVAVACVAVAACGNGGSGGGDDDAIDVCEVPSSNATGAVEIGRGDPYAPMMEGDPIEVQFGPQGLWMFVVRARAEGLSIVPAVDTGAVRFSAINSKGETISLDLGCEDRNFEDVGDGSVVTKNFFLAVFPSFSADLDGGMVTLQASVRDKDGNEAFGSTVVTSMMPPQ